MKLALGTVQFGLPYGIANSRGQVPMDDVEEILEIAKNSGIKYLDTAIAYGTSETILGSIGVSWAKLITKISSVPNDCNNVRDWVKSEIEASLDRLGVTKLDTVLLHKPSDILTNNGPALLRSLTDLQSEGLLNKIGYSIYDPCDLENLMNEFTPDLVQAPYNILDRRLEQSGWLKKLKKNSIEVHTRSTFLQGLLLMNKDERPLKFNKWDKIFTMFDDWLCIEQITAKQASFSFVNKNELIDNIVVGVDCPSQLNEILKLVNLDSIDIPGQIISQDELLINPSNWHLI